jgi:hypothetical protein
MPIHKRCEACQTQLIWVYHGESNKFFANASDGNRHLCPEFSSEEYFNRRKNNGQQDAIVTTQRYRMTVSPQPQHQQTSDIVVQKLDHLESMLQELTLKVTSCLPLDTRQR